MRDWFKKKVNVDNNVILENKPFKISLLCSPRFENCIPMMCIQLNKIIRYCKSNNFEYEVIIVSEYDKPLFNSIDRFDNNNHDETNGKGIYTNCKTKYYQAQSTDSMEARRRRLLWFTESEYGIFINETCIYRPEIVGVVRDHFERYQAASFIVSTRGLYYSLADFKFYNKNDCDLIAQRRKKYKEVLDSSKIVDSVIMNNQYMFIKFGWDLNARSLVDIDRSRIDNAQDTGCKLLKKDYMDEETKEEIKNIEKFKNGK